MRADSTFEGDDLRQQDQNSSHPVSRNTGPPYSGSDQLCHDRFHQGIIHLAVRWMLDQGISVALWGARRPDQLEATRRMAGWRLDAQTRAQIDRILSETITDPVGPEFMAEQRS